MNASTITIGILNMVISEIATTESMMIRVVVVGGVFLIFFELIS